MIPSVDPTKNRPGTQLTAAQNPEAVDFIEKLFLGMVALGVFGILLVAARAIVYGFSVENLLQTLIFFLFLVIMLFRKKIPVNHMVFVCIGLCWAFSIATIYSWGLASQGYAILTIVFIVCAVFYGRVGAFILFFFTSFFFIVVVQKFVSGEGYGSLDVAKFSASPLGWGLEAFVVVFIIGYLSFLLEGYSQSLRRRMQLLKEKQRGLENERRLRADIVRKQDILYKEKDALVREVHHRVQNNLHVISSLIQYQAISIKDEEACNLLSDIRSRILAFSILHKEINLVDGEQTVNFSRYAGEIARILAVSRQREKIEVEVEDSYTLLPLDTALPCGLVAYEVLSMMLKKHYSLEKEGYRIRLVFNRRDLGAYFFSIEVLGVDLGRMIRGEQDGMGFSLVKQVCELLGADYQFATAEGTRFYMVFQEYQEAGAELF